MDKEFDILWVEVKIPWGRSPIYHGKGVQNTMGRGSKYHGQGFNIP
jgi:hypothetical protein